MIKSRWFWLFFISILALGIRIYGLDFRGIQYDDAFSIFLASQDVDAIIEGTAADTMPPLFYFLLYYWLLISRELEWIRLLGIILSLGIVWGIYYLTKLLAGEKEGVIAAFLVAISPLQYYHAQDVRMYTLLALFQIGYAIFFVRIWQGTKTTQWMDWVGLIFCGAGAMYSHNLAIVGLVIPNLVLLFQQKWKLLMKFIGAQVGIALIFLPWIFYLPGQLAKVQGAFWTPLPGATEVTQAIVIATTNLPVPEFLLPVALGLSVMGLVLIGFELWKRKPDTKLVYVIAVVVFPPAAQFIISYFTRPVFVPRSFIFSLLGYLVLAAVAVGSFRKPVISYLILGIFIVGSIIGIPSQARYDNFPRSPFEEAAKFLATAKQAEDLVVHDNKLSYFPMFFFDPTLPQVFLADEPGTPNDTLATATQRALKIFPIDADDLDEALSKSHKVFLVIFEKTINEYSSAGKNHPLLVNLAQRLHLTQTYRFNDLDIFEFVK